MSLQEKILELLGRWDGQDAVSRTAQRQDLVNELIRLVARKDETPPKPAVAPVLRQATG